MAVETIQRVCAKIGERSPLSADLKTKWGPRNFSSVKVSKAEFEGGGWLVV